MVSSPSPDVPPETPRPPYPQPHPYPPPYPYPYPVQPPFNTLAILAAVFAFVVFPPLGIYLGNKAKREIARTGERGIELANVGVIGGWIMTCLQGDSCLCGAASSSPSAPRLPRTYGDALILTRS